MNVVTFSPPASFNLCAFLSLFKQNVAAYSAKRGKIYHSFASAAQVQKKRAPNEEAQRW